MRRTREPHFQGASAARLAALRWRAGHPGGNRQAFRTQRPGAGCAPRQTRYHSRLVPPTGGRKIRQLQAAPIARAAAHQSRDRGSGGALGSRELRLGPRPDCGSIGQYQVSDQTVGNILRRHGLGPVSETSKTTTWRDFIRRHMDVLAGTDFFTVDVLTWRGLVTYYVLFFIHLDSRRVSIADITDHPEACWMRQVACNATFEGIGQLNGCRYVLHDRDASSALSSARPWQPGA